MSEPRSVEAVVTDEPDGPTLPNDVSAPPQDFPAWGRLEDQIRWYDSHSLHNQHWFKALKLVQILVAAAIPVAAGLEAPMWLVGGAGAPALEARSGIDSMPDLAALERWLHGRAA